MAEESGTATAGWSALPEAGSLVGPVPRGDIFVRDRTLGTTTLESGRPDGKPSNGTSLLPLVSRDGGCVVFQSYASDLVGGDTNGAGDVFVRDLAAGTTSRVSLGAGGLEANGTSTPKAVSADCRYVAFTSSASNLIAGVTVQGMQLYVRDRQTGATTLESVGYDGKPGDGPVSFAAISGDGRWLAFATTAANMVPNDRNGTFDVFLRDRLAGKTVPVSVTPGGAVGNGLSVSPFVSDDGSLVAFASRASNLVAGDTNGLADGFVRDLKAGTTTRFTLAAGGGQANGDTLDLLGMTPDGRYILTGALATNLAKGDTNTQPDAFLYDRTTRTTARVSVGAGGAQGDGPLDLDGGGLSADGRTVAFDSGPATSSRATATGPRTCSSGCCRQARDGGLSRAAASGRAAAPRSDPRGAGSGRTRAPACSR